ncbi:helix-turn-helix transcriptional regulator [Bacillus wiedmannii]|uniref:helix-turn-helix transcriptional regulator n=2 Tax=Bacillus wiedmannii TaxID=1890302 RepID=UPI000BFE9F67|nr:helix-turn-helix domain-containing protein [Bacillus wiedmannii]PHF09326.1 transcriptional regulator [Bacillus wiedmannii]
MKCKLKEILDERMIKQGALAKRANITPQQFSQIIHGKSEPSLRNAIKIAKILELHVEDIWIEEEVE